MVSSVKGEALHRNRRLLFVTPFLEGSSADSGALIGTIKCLRKMPLTVDCVADWKELKSKRLSVAELGAVCFHELGCPSLSEAVELISGKVARPCCASS